MALYSYALYSYGRVRWIHMSKLRLNTWMCEMREISMILVRANKPGPWAYDLRPGIAATN